MEFIKQIYDFLMSPAGAIATSAFFGIVAQLFTYKGMVINKKTNKEWDTFISEGVGYIITIFVAWAIYIKVNKDFMVFLINSGSGLACHIIYAKWISKWLDKKGKEK